MEPSKTVVTLTGNPNNTYFKLGPIHARRLGLAADPLNPSQLLLTDGADPGSELVLPNGVRLTAYDLTSLEHKSGGPERGWEIWSQDGGGFPPSRSR